MADFDPFVLVWDCIGSWLRPYQKRWLLDRSQLRVANKSRQIGFTDVTALSTVLDCAGIIDPATSASASWVSKDDESAKKGIGDCWRWLDILREDQKLRDEFLTSSDNVRHGSTRFCGFESRGMLRKIFAEAPTARAGRSRTGHLVLDECAWYGPHGPAIWTGAMPIIISKPSLRATVLSTPNGAGNHFHDLVTDRQRWPDWSLHEVDIHQAIAAGFPTTAAKARALCETDEEYQQEFELSFLASAGQYMGEGLLRDASGIMPPFPELRLRVIGIDVASTTDLTTAVGLYEHMPTGVMYLGDVWAISGIPYASRPGKPGQDRILDALIRHLQPEAVIMDATGDGAKLFGYLMALGQHCPILPHTISADWKNTWVPRVRGELESGKLVLASGATRMFHKSAGFALLTKRADTREHAAAVAEEGFAEQPFRMLRNDFLKVHRTLRANSLTYDTHRDKRTGHGDSYWSSVLALYAFRSGAAGGRSIELGALDSLPLAEQDFVRYLRGS